MDAQSLWLLFLSTGLPEAYSLYRARGRVEETAEPAGKTA